MQPQLSIIIVSYKVKDLLVKCLDSIYKNQGDLTLEIIIVDNASGDGTAETIKEKFPQARLIASNKNLGFAKANNLAIKQATGEQVLLLNPDTEIFSDTLSKSLEVLKRYGDCGVLGVQMFYPDGRPQPSVRRLPTLWPIILMLLKLPKFFPHLKSIDYYLAEDFNYAKEQEAEQVMGAFMLIPRLVLDKIGLLDERFFVWFEEVDFCRRARQAGYKIIYTPAAKIIHYGGKSFGQQKVITNQWRFFKSAVLYFLK
ncbi:MAG: glycosyltransferase family 2 protein [Candidatus Buchananbacteria bacterium]